MKKLVIRSTFSGPAATDRIAVAIARELLRRRISVGLVGECTEELEPFKLHVENVRFRCLYVGPLDTRMPAPYDAVYVPWEATSVPAGFVDRLNQCQQVIVPTRWQAKVFRKSGVRSQMAVVPYGIDPEVYTLADALPRVGRFCTAGRLRHGVRKGVEATIAAFKLAFGDSVGPMLIVKVSPDDRMPTGAGGNVFVTRDELKPTDLARLYASCQAFVTASAGEGWGLHAHEAMACGRPVIAAPFAGLSAFLTPGNAFTVPFTLETTANPALYGSLAKWAVPSLLHMAEVMRLVAAQPTLALVRGLQASRDVARLTTENMVDGLVEVLDA